MMQKILSRLTARLGGSLLGGMLLAAGPALAQAPANDDCATATPVAVSAGCVNPVNGTVASATQSLAPVASCGFNVLAANDVWYSFVATGANQLITLAPRFAAIMDVRSGVCTASASVFCAAIFNGNTAASNVTGLTSGATYFVRVYASGTTPPAGIGSTFALCVSPGLTTTVPPNDDCAGAIDVPVQAGGVCTTQTAGDNTDATPTVGLADPTCANYRGADIWFKVTVPASGSLTVQTVTPAQTSLVTNTGMAIYAGTCTSLTPLGCDDNSAGNLKSLLNISGRTAGEVLYVRVWSFGGLTTGPIAMCAVTYSIPANDDCAGAVAVPVTTGCTAPVNGTVALATQSLPPTANCGTATAAADVWYSFVATGTTQSVILNSSYQTVLDVRSGTCASSASVFCAVGFGSNPRTISGLTAGQTYFLRIYAPFAPTQAQAAFTLCINPGLTVPANDDCAGAVALPTAATCAAPTTGTVALATQSLPPTTACGNTTVANDVWYSFTAAGTTQNILFVGAFQGVVDIRSGTCASSSSVYCSTIFNNQLLTATGLASGQTYFLRLYVNGTFVPANGSFTLCLSGGSVPPFNDECANAVPLTVSATCTTPTSGTVQAASQSLPPTTGCSTVATAADVWYSFTATGATQNITFVGGFQAVADVRTGTCASSTSVFCATVFSNQVTTASGLSSGQTYFLRIYNNNTFTPTNATFTLCLNPGTVPPANDDCANAIALPVALSCATPVGGTYAGASQSLPPTTGCGAAVAVRDVWYAFVAGGPTQTLAVTGTFQAVAEVRSGTCASSTSVFCGTTFAGQSLILTGLTSGQTYFLRLYPLTNVAPTPTTGIFTLCLTAGPPPSPNDDCATAVAVPVVVSCTTSTNGSVYNASQSLPPTVNCGTTGPTAADVWYSFVAASPTELLTLTPRFAAVLDVRSGTCASSTSIFCNTVPAFAATGTVVGGLSTGQTYYVRIYASGATPPTLANATFTLCITPAPTPPANDECAGAVPLPVTAACATPLAGTVEGASQSLPPTASCGTAIIAADVWYSFVASGVTQLLTLTGRSNLVVDVRSGTCGSSSSILCAAVPANSAAGTVIGGLTAGQTYYLRIFANGTTQPTPLNAAFTLCLNPGPVPPPNDDCAAAVALTVSATCTPTSGTVAGASQSVAPTANCGFATGAAADVWYSFVATGVTHTITLAPLFNAVLDVRSGPCASSTSIFCAAVNSGNPTAQLVGGFTVGQTYFLRIYSVAFVPPTGATAAFTVCVTPAPTPPANDECAGAINVPVQFGSTCTMSSVSSNVAATGSSVAAPSCGAGYQGGDVWYKVTVPANGTVTVQTVAAPTNDVGDTGMSIYSGACGSLTEVGCDDDGGGNFKSLLTLSGRTPGQVLYIRVWAFNNNSGNLAVCVTSPTSCTAPTALAASSASDPVLTWTPGGTPAAGTTYSVEYGPQGFALGTGTVISGIVTPSVTLTGLLPLTAYCFYVQQVCPGTTGTSAYAGPQCFTTPAAPPCTAPSAPMAANLTATTADLSWLTGGMPLPGTTYTVEYGPQGFTQGTGTVVASLGTPMLALTGLAPSIAYCFYVRQNCPGTPGTSSAYVGPTCFTTTATPACPAPSNPQATALSPNSATLTWTPGTPTTLGSYTINYGPPGFNPNTSGTMITSIMVPGFTLTGLASLPTVCYYVRQVCPGNTTAWVGPACATLLASRAATEAATVQLYPNPSGTGAVTLQLTALPVAGQAALLNAVGQVVRTLAVPAGSSSTRLSTQGLAAGLYTLRLTTGGNTLTRKLVLE